MTKFPGYKLERKTRAGVTVKGKTAGSVGRECWPRTCLGLGPELWNVLTCQEPAARGPPPWSAEIELHLHSACTVHTRTNKLHHGTFGAMFCLSHELMCAQLVICRRQAAVPTSHSDIIALSFSHYITGYCVLSILAKLWNILRWTSPP